MANYTKRQGQYLAFIYYYTKLNKRSPSEKDIQNYFRVTAPTVHQAVITLEKNGFIKKIPRKARSIELLISGDDLPDLE